ncbi:MAG: amidohydrolase family protein [Pseudomonadota bacterium]
MPTPQSPEWYASVKEEIIDPDRPIIDPHHHLWTIPSPMWGRYELEELWGDTESGHNIEKTIFMECRSNYREDAPIHLQSLGETEYVAGVAAESAKVEGKATIAGIIGFVDMRLGSGVEEILAAHEEAGQGLFRGIRHGGACDETGTLKNAGRPDRSPPGLYADADFRQGVKRLGELGYTYDTWHFFHQNRDYLALAKAVPDTPMIFDHFGVPLGVGAYEGKQEEIFPQWKEDVAAIAECPNVIAKLGGLAMPDNGFGWHLNERPPTSDEFVAAQARYYLHTIECFGPERCMFESNYPVDRLSVSYHVIWNGMKKIVADFSEDEKHAMFYGTATRIYRV